MRATLSKKCVASCQPLPPNAPVQARWANAQRAGPAPPNPPTVACNRLLGYSSIGLHSHATLHGCERFPAFACLASEVRTKHLRVEITVTRNILKPLEK